MKIVVLIKSVPDTASIFKVAEDNKFVVIGNPKFIMSPYDEYALEEAIKVKESVSGEVVVVSFGDENALEVMRTALAVGADSAILVENSDADSFTGKGVSKVLAAVIKTLSPNIIFAGKQAVDDDGCQVPERVAEILGISHASAVTRFELQGLTAEADREVEGGYCTMEITFPALCTVEKGINTPRYPTLPNIMKAKRKEIRKMTLEELNLSADDVRPGLTVNSISLPRQERLLKKLEGEIGAQVKQLTSILREEKIGL